MNTKHTPGPLHVFSVYAQHEVRTSTDTLVAVVNSREDARLFSAAPELLEACATFAEWMRREKEGFANSDERDTPEGEARWRTWYNENLRLCDLAQEQALAAVAKATAVHKHRFENTYCSQCGGEFGPGDSGYSHCADHRKATGASRVHDQ